jgi:hypothetical protein
VRRTGRSWKSGRAANWEFGEIRESSELGDQGIENWEIGEIRESRELGDQGDQGDQGDSY